MVVVFLIPIPTDTAQSLGLQEGRSITATLPIDENIDNKSNTTPADIDTTRQIIFAIKQHKHALERLQIATRLLIFITARGWDWGMQ